MADAEPDQGPPQEHNDDLYSEEEEGIKEVSMQEDEEATLMIEQTDETTYINGLDTSSYDAELPKIMPGVRRYNYEFHPLGVEIERRLHHQKMEAFYLQSGDSFNCNERENALALRILTMTTQFQREQVESTSNKRSPKNAFAVIIQAVSYEYKVKYGILEFKDGSFTARVVKAFWKIMSGFNATKKQGFNPVLARISFIYAMIRLGRPPYRSCANEFNAGLEAIKSYFKEETNTEYTRAHPFMLVVYDLLRLHGRGTINRFPLPKIPKDKEQLIEQTQLNCRAFQIEVTQSKFYKESREEVVVDLRQVCDRYELTERENLSSYKEMATWIANDLPEGVVRNTPKRKSPPTGTTVVKVPRKSLNSAHGSLRL
jgi:hypothetical protein